MLILKVTRFGQGFAMLQSLCVKKIGIWNCNVASLTFTFNRLQKMSLKTLPRSIFLPVSRCLGILKTDNFFSLGLFTTLTSYFLQSSGPTKFIFFLRNGGILKQFLHFSPLVEGQDRPEHTHFNQWEKSFSICHKAGAA